MSEKKTRKECIADWTKKAFDLIHEIPRDEKGNPLTLEGAIRSMILKCPDMIQWRDDALDMMYCTLGAGIDWNKHGRLADTNPNNYMNPPPAAGGQGVWSHDFGMDDSMEEMDLPADFVEKLKERHMRTVFTAIETVRDIDNRCREYRKERTAWYPFSWYGCNLCAPGNAQDDFFAGAIETALLVKQTDVDDSRYWAITHWASLRRAQNTAAEILEALIIKDKQRKGKP